MSAAIGIWAGGERPPDRDHTEFGGPDDDTRAGFEIRRAPAGPVAGADE